MLRGFLTKAFERAHLVATIGYGVGNAILAAKNGLNFTFETAAGLIFLTCPAAMAMASRFPVGAYRAAGVAWVTGALCLTTKGLLHDDPGLVTSSLIMAVPGAIMTLHHEIPKLAKICTKGFAGKALAVATGYPILLSAGLDAATLPGLISSAVTKGDTLMYGVIGAWSIGCIGLAASDPHLQSWVNNRISPPKSLPKPLPTPANENI